MEELAPYLRGWRSYFGFCETPKVLIGLTRWVQPRLRVLCGGSGNTASSASGSAPVGRAATAGQQYRQQRPRPLVPCPCQGPLGRALQCLLPIARASDSHRWVLAQPTRTAVYGPVRAVVWQGSAGDRRPYADLVGLSEKCPKSSSHDCCREPNHASLIGPGGGGCPDNKRFVSQVRFEDSWHGYASKSDSRVAVGIPVARYPRTDPYGRSLAHTALISDEWRQSAASAKDEARAAGVASGQRAD